MVVIQNTGDQPFVGLYAAQKYALPPGQQMVVPFMAMCLWMGHPEAFDVPNDPERKFRTDEFARLTTRYGVYDDAFLVYVEGPDEGKTVWQVKTPKIRAVDIQTQEQIITVMDDPMGELSSPGAEAIRQQQTTAQMMAQMQQQIITLQSQLAAMQADPSTPITVIPPEHGATDTKAVAPTAQPGAAPIPTTADSVPTVPNIQPPGTVPEPSIPVDAPQRTKVVS